MKNIFFIMRGEVGQLWMKIEEGALGVLVSIPLKKKKKGCACSNYLRKCNAHGPRPRLCPHASQMSSTQLKPLGQDLPQWPNHKARKEKQIIK